jgi:hypothetical protein
MKQSIGWGDLDDRIGDDRRRNACRSAVDSKEDRVAPGQRSLADSRRGENARSDGDAVELRLAGLRARDVETADPMTELGLRRSCRRRELRIRGPRVDSLEEL